MTEKQVLSIDYIFLVCPGLALALFCGMRGMKMLTAPPSARVQGERKKSRDASVPGLCGDSSRKVVLYERTLALLERPISHLSLSSKVFSRGHGRDRRAQCVM